MDERHRALYEGKPDGYFDGAREDIVALMPENPAAVVLEIGCGNGVNAILAKSAGKAGRYIGIEMNEAAARDAGQVVDTIYVGDAERFDYSSLEPIDVVIMSEVLEHLVDPWKLVSKVAGVMKCSGTIFASSPNIANAALIRELLKGQFRYAQSGVMDRTHLRWFTPSSYRSLFEDAGFTTTSLSRVGGIGRKPKILNFLTARNWEHLTMQQMLYCGAKEP